MVTFLSAASTIEIFGFIPSPSVSTIDLGPLTIHAYGICIAVAMLCAITLSSRRWIARGGAAEDITAVATWGIPVGIIGARAYHVITDFHLYRDDLWGILDIRDGGLGIWGGIAAGVIAGLMVAKRRGLDRLNLLDTVAPALAVGQAIGRFGNYFNQELFGRPTNLPWGLHISPDKRPDAYAQFSTFHPTFLYESLWNLGLAATLMLIDRKKDLRKGRIFLLYVAGYTFARFFMELLRIDPANSVFGLRVNAWLSLLLFSFCLGLLLRARLSTRVMRKPTSGR